LGRGKTEGRRGTEREREREREKLAGRGTDLIIQIQSLKGKCVFQTVKMINEGEQILTNALV